MSQPNYDKLRLGATLASNDGDNHNHGDCFNYGSVSGCDDGCPVLLEGRCKTILDAFPTEYKKALDDDDFEHVLNLSIGTS